VTAKAKKELKGRHVLMMLLAFFGVMLAVNIYFTVMAVKSFRGEDVPRSYRQGLEYNQTLESRAAQKAIGWTVRANLAQSSYGDRIILDVRDKDGRSIPNLAIKAVLRHPADTALDIPLDFESDGIHYSVNIATIKGKWLLVATARTETQQLKFEHELWR